MAFRWEVHEYWKDETKGEGYKYHPEYQGQSFLKAIWTMWKLKRAGAACLKLEWR